MRKAGIIALALFLSPVLLAQQTQQPPAQPEQWAAVTCYVPTQVAAPAQPQAQTPAPQMPKRPHPLDPADVESITGRPYQAAAWGKAPKPGHPLDWTDVEILTGRARGSSSQPYARSGYGYGAVPYVYVPMNVPYYGDSYSRPVFTQTRPLFAPRVFRRLVTNPGFFFSR